MITPQTSQKQPIILMYQSIIGNNTLLPDNRETGADLYTVPVTNFRAQMHWLKSQGYVARHWQEALLSPNDSVVITFDDGEMNQFELAFPILQELGFQASFFIIANRVNKPGYMNFDHLHDLHKAGMIIGSHGFSHAVLTNLLQTQAEEELIASKKYLERNLNIEINSFSIPRWFCDDNIIQLAHDAGYQHIFISDNQEHLSVACLSRVAIRRRWTLKRFQQAIQGQIIWKEETTRNLINRSKKILGEGNYNLLRGLLLKIGL